jgi:hypothetical protein
MPINLAKCLWGVDLSKAASASISASYPELGISEVVTTSSKVVGDTFQVSAAGFHFSAPIIKMKVTQSANAQPVEPEPVVKPAFKVINKSTITCIKGKTTKKVTSATPKCPAGYKKK